MNQTEQILSKYVEFEEYLQTVDLNELRKIYSRHELTEFRKQLYGVKLRSIAYEVGQMIDEMKKEEYPELLGVHHYPILRKIDFLSEDEKKKLDDFLLAIRPNNYVTGLWRVAGSEKSKQIEQFLIDNNVVEEKHFALCPNCWDEHISSSLTNKQREQLEAILADKEDEDRYEKLAGILLYGCGECHEEFDFDELNQLQYKTALKLIMERDTSLDNV